MPAWAQSFVELPSLKFFGRNLIIFSLLAALPLATKQWLNGAIAIGLALSAFMLYNRGHTATSSTSLEEEMTREIKQGPILKTLGFTVFSALAGGLVSSFLPLASLGMEFAIAAGVNLGLFASCTFFKVQDA